MEIGRMRLGVYWGCVGGLAPFLPFPQIAIFYLEPVPSNVQKDPVAFWDQSSPISSCLQTIYSGLGAFEVICPGLYSCKLAFSHRVAAGKGAEAKPVLSKKEKMKLRRARWLQKIDAIKAAEETRKAEARRKATAVVGDLHPLMEALPELSELVTVSRPRRKLKSAPRQKAEPTDFSRMTPAQKRKLLDDEMARFQEVVTSPSYQADPLRAIGEHLSKRLRQEEEAARL
ncbi:ribosome biogenesis protein SLX9 homolog isoform X2 [Notamacropus eugenii]|uniref:ribosome biogenesis protein SLX9 homolog isoform X2 n=1 Tax=Notamacropus eugenii TaxID=9315 RepID=UPI003B66FD6B